MPSVSPDYRTFCCRVLQKFHECHFTSIPQNPYSVRSFSASARDLQA
jgi:hypothetical protein